MQNSSIGSGPRRRSGPLRTSRAASRQSVDIAGGGAGNAGGRSRNTYGGAYAPFSGPKCSPIGSTSDFFRAKTEFQIGRHTLSLPGGRYVTYELQPCTLARMFSTTSELTGPNIDSKCPENNLEIRFFAKMAAKTTPGSGFRPYSCSPRSTWSFSQKSQKFFRGTFLRYLGSKLKTSKII